MHRLRRSFMKKKKLPQLLRHALPLTPPSSGMLVLSAARLEPSGGPSSLQLVPRPSRTGAKRAAETEEPALRSRKFRKRQLFTPSPERNAFEQDEAAWESAERKACIRADNFLRRSLARRWAFYEFVYGSGEASFFAHSEFEELLLSLGLPCEGSRPRTHWARLRARIGKPRRLSPKFLLEERARLHEHASSQLEPLALPPGTRCLALHPESREPAIGEVLAASAEDPVGWVRVRFEGAGPGSSAPEVLMEAWRLLPVAATASGLDDSAAGRPYAPYTEQDLEEIAKLLQLLERKDRALHRLQQLNEIGEQRLADGTPFDSEFREAYAQAIVALERANRALEPALDSLRRLTRRADTRPAPAHFAEIADAARLEALHALRAHARPRARSQQQPDALREEEEEVLATDPSARSVAAAAAAAAGEVEEETGVNEERERERERMVCAAVALLAGLRRGLERALPASELRALVATLLQPLRPRAPANLPAFARLESLVLRLI